MTKRKIWQLRDDAGFMTGATGVGVGIIIFFAVLVAVASTTTGMVHKKNTEKVGGMTFQQVLDSDTPKATPKPAPAAPVDNSSSSNSQPAQQVQPVEPPPQVVVIGGGTDDSSSTHSGSSSSTTKTPCPASPMFPIPRLQETHPVPEDNMTPAPTPGC